MLRNSRRHPRTPGPAVAALLALLLLASPASGEPGGYLLKVELGTSRLEGLPLAWSKKQVVLLDREGRMVVFDPEETTSFQQTTLPFSGYTAGGMRSRLLGEFGKAFDVTGTGRYLVVHPRGRGAEWSGRFEELYNSFVHYFRVRGFRLREPGFPLVAVVLPSRQDFIRYAAREGTQVDDNILGYYSPMSNRVALYDLQAGGRADWQSTAATIIHEATHQTAFNTGVHSRFVQSPRWLVEGLGLLFEAPGVWSSRQHPRARDRINPSRLADFRALTSRRGEGRLAEMISSDRCFRADPLGAYAEAWALTHFLVETQPRAYGAYLKRVSARPDFQPYTSQERLADFTAVFGTNLQLLEARFLKHVAGL